MAAQRSIRQRRRGRGDSVVKLNLASMIDMFTLLVVFLLQNYSSGGQLVTPAQGLVLPSSSIEKQADEALMVKVSQNNIMVENTVVLDERKYKELVAQKEYMIPPLYNILTQYAKESRISADRFKTEFSGKISIQGDGEIPYNVLTRIMYTCGQSGFPNMNLVVYRK